MRKKSLLALLLSLSMIFALSACGTSSSGSSSTASGGSSTAEGDSSAAESEVPSDLTIAYSAIAGSDLAPWTGAIWNTLQSECDEKGWDFYPLSAAGSVDTQAEQIESLIAQEPDYFLLFAGDVNMAVDWVKEISEAGIPVIMVALDVAEEGQQYVSAFVGPDQEAMTQKVAQTIIDKNGADAGLNIVCISGVPVQQDYIVREAGFTETIKANSNYTILDTQYAMSSRDQAKAYMEQYLSTYGDKIDVVMGYDDDLTMGAIQAIDEAGKTGEIQVYSITGQNEALTAISEGKLEMTVMNRADLVAKKSIDVVEALAKGETVEYNQPTELTYIDSTNIAQYLGTGEF
ncbi:MAG: ribose transport system substrate-binding protein [Oscillospiraceae bacterium]|nr:ribose transport system substrate-binding protein [Oscillospiraceae bacterium]